MLTINVTGIPAPQGSKRGFYNPGLGRVQMVESSKKVKPWRQDVQAGVAETLALLADGTIASTADIPLTGPLIIAITFYLPRPGYHYGTGKNAGTLKANAPSYVDKKPDVDKLVRSTLDGLKEAGLYRDDAQVAQITAVKRYADAATGARIAVGPLIDAPAAAPSAAAGAEAVLF